MIVSGIILINFIHLVGSIMVFDCKPNTIYSGKIWTIDGFYGGMTYDAVGFGSDQSYFYMVANGSIYMDTWISITDVTSGQQTVSLLGRYCVK